jgi:hypothetical protein
MNASFQYDSRLGISIPVLKTDWERYTHKEQEEILLEWEKIRDTIPDRIKELEVTIMAKQKELDEEEDFHRSCLLNSEISDLASIINDLHLWYRVDQDLTVEKGHQ